MASRAHRLDVPATILWNNKSNRKHFLDYIIKKFNINVLAEVGVRDGRTTFYLLDQNPNLTIYAIDKSISGFYNSEIKKKYSERLIPLEGLSADCANLLPDNFLDLVFIDADHSYNGCKQDIIKYRPKLKQNGWLSGHDIDYPGVNKAVNELVPDFDVGPNYVWVKLPNGITRKIFQ